MNKGLLLLAVICALIAFASSRPLMFYAAQSDSAFSLDNGWEGVAIAFANFRKGQLNHRVRIFGVNHINETQTGAWLMFQNGTIITHLGISGRSTRYFLGDVLMNDTYFDYLLQEKIYATVASTNHRNGSISGYFRCRPHSGVSLLTASQVVSGSTSTGVGLGWAAIKVAAIEAGTLPTDIIDQDTLIASTSLFYGRVIHNNTNTTTITFNGPANFTSTAPVLATATLSGLYNDGKFNDIAINELFYALDVGQTYYLVDGAPGSIRGQIYPLLSATRRQIPFKANTVFGNTRVPSGGFSTLRYANQEGNDRNPNSYISLVSVANPTDFEYQGLFYFKSSTNRKNFELVRGLTVELNAKIIGDADWFFEFFDSTSGLFIPAGTISLADAPSATWTPAYVDYFSTSTSDFANNRKEVVIRVSTTSTVQSTLSLDLFGVRSWIPSAFTNQAWRATMKLFLTLDATYP